MARRADSESPAAIASRIFVCWTQARSEPTRHSVIARLISPDLGDGLEQDEENLVTRQLRDGVVKRDIVIRRVVDRRGRLHRVDQAGKFAHRRRRHAGGGEGGDFRLEELPRLRALPQPVLAFGQSAIDRLLHRQAGVVEQFHADAVANADQPTLLQFLHRLADHHAADAQLGHQLALRGKQFARA